MKQLAKTMPVIDKCGSANRNTGQREALKTGRYYGTQKTSDRGLVEHLQFLQKRASQSFDDNQRMVPSVTVFASRTYGGVQQVCAFVEVSNILETGGCDSTPQCQSE